MLAAGPAAAAPTWVWPLDPPPGVVEGFDPPDDPYGTGHRGVDLLGSPGQLVLAVAPGRVTFAGQVAGLDVVVVDHGRLRSTYQPVVAQVRVGARVAAGDRLGTLTTYGSHCLPDTCLHLGARHGDTYRDPLDFLPGGPLRLLPLDGPRAGRPAGSHRRLAPATRAGRGDHPLAPALPYAQALIRAPARHSSARDTAPVAGWAVRRGGAPAGRRCAAARR